jgi:hypothetical protein
MEYRNIDGNVYCRYASTPPVLNSDMATAYGIKAPCLVEPGEFSGFKAGRNVKLRIALDGGSRKMTCHGTIDWVGPDVESGQIFVGFGNLSLSDEEFVMLQKCFADQPAKPVEFGESVRDKAREAETIEISDQAREIKRMKVVNFPVSVIDLIDAHRQETPFSDFVVSAVREYVKRMDGTSA